MFSPLCWQHQLNTTGITTGVSSIIFDLVPLWWWWWWWSAWTFELIISWRSVVVNIQFLTWKSSNRTVNVRILHDHKSVRIIFLKDKPHTASYFQWNSLNFEKKNFIIDLSRDWAKPNGLSSLFPPDSFPFRPSLSRERGREGGPGMLSWCGAFLKIVFVCRKYTNSY